jgi:cytochrome c-type biogenesis protein CcmH/NrfG
VNPDVLADLEEQRSFLRRSLDDIERELGAGDIDALDAGTLRTDYAQRLAEVERSIETGHTELTRSAPPRRRGRTVAAVVVVAALAIGAGVTVANMAGSRKPGQTATGTIRQNTNNKLSQAAQLASSGKFAEALAIYDGVVAKDPGNIEALSERGLLLVTLANATAKPELGTRGRTSIEAALKLEPHNARALFYLGLAKRLAGDDAGAKQAFDDALATNPPAALKTQIEQFRASIGG